MLMATNKHKHKVMEASPVRDQWISETTKEELKVILKIVLVIKDNQV